MDIRYLSRTQKLCFEMILSGWESGQLLTSKDLQRCLNYKSRGAVDNLVNHLAFEGFIKIDRRQHPAVLLPTLALLPGENGPLERGAAFAPADASDGAPGKPIEWTPNREMLLTVMWEQGDHPAMIAEALACGLSTNAVRCHAAKMKLDPRKRGGAYLPAGTGS